jgi:hypothetical protein
MKLRAVGIAAAILIMLACLRLAGVGGGGADAVMWGKAGRSKPGTFDKPRCVAVATDLTVWVLDLTGRIQHFTADGEYLGQIQMPDVSVGRPQGIDVDRHGFIYVADTHYFQIIKFDPSGKILLRFGEKGTEPGKLFWPCAIKIADDGIIYTAEYGGGHDRIQKWSPEGRYLGGWGAFGLGDARWDWRLTAAETCTSPMRSTIGYRFFLARENCCANGAAKGL